MSINLDLDLDFKDYTPTSATSIPQQQPQRPQQPEIQVRIPLPTDSANSFKQNVQSARTVLNVLQNVTNLQSGKSTPNNGSSDETLQQLMWLSTRQKNIQQRGSIASSGNWGLGFFAQYFDVTTNDVLQRIIWSAVPIRKTGIDLDDLNDSELTASLATNMALAEGSDHVDDNLGSGDGINSRVYEQLGSKRKYYSYIERFIQSRPDFYGPFWISATLVFTIAIFSNLISFMSHRSKLYMVNKSLHDNIGNSTNSSEVLATLMKDQYNQLDEWHYSMNELSTATSVVAFYVTLLPTFLWFLFWFRGCNKYYTLSETICAYGYSLSIFIPLSFLLMIQATIVRYLAITLASLLSGLVLVMSFLPMIRSDPNAGSNTILIIVPAFHFGLAYILHRIMLLQ